MRFELKKEPWNDMNRNSLMCNTPNTMVSPITGDFVVKDGVSYIIKELHGNYMSIEKLALPK